MEKFDAMKNNRERETGREIAVAWWNSLSEYEKLSHCEHIFGKDERIYKTLIGREIQRIYEESKLP